MKKRRKPLKKSNPTATLAEVIKKLKEIDKENLNHAKAKFEFLKLNNDFQKDIKKLKEITKHPICQLRTKKTTEKEGDEMLRKAQTIESMIMNIEDKWRVQMVETKYKSISLKKIWNQLTTEDKKMYKVDMKGATTAILEIQFKIVLDLNLSFDETILNLLKVKKNRKTEEGYLESCRYFSFLLNDLITEDDKFYYGREGHFEEHGTFYYPVDLKLSKNKLMKNFEAMIDEEQPKVSKTQMKARRNNRYDLYPVYIQVHDMREKDKLKWREIADRVFPNDADSGNSETKVKQYFKEAKRLIKTVADF